MDAIKIIEVPMVPDMPDSKEMREAVAQLAHHPGWQYLANKFRKQRALLLQLLLEDGQEIRKTDNIRNGIRWIDFHLAQVGATNSRVSRDATVQETASFQEIHSMLEELS